MSRPTYEGILSILEGVEQRLRNLAGGAEVVCLSDMETAFLLDEYRNEDPPWPPNVKRAVGLLDRAVSDKTLFTEARLTMVRDGIGLLRTGEYGAATELEEAVDRAMDLLGPGRVARMVEELVGRRTAS